MHKTDLTFIPGKSKWIMLVLLFLWSLAQPAAVIDSVPLEPRYQLFFWKNMLGVIVIGYGLGVIVANLSQRRYPLVHAKLFWISMLFPSYSLFNMLFRGQGTSLEEQLLYFLWPLALFVVFPAFFPGESDRHRGLIVLWLTNFVALLYAIIQGAGDENLVSWLDYRYRVYFDFLQPNIYSASWSIVFAISIYFYIKTQSLLWKKFFLLLFGAALMFIFLARSESMLLFCIGILFTLFITYRKLDRNLRLSCVHIVLAILVLVFSPTVLNRERLNSATSSRILVWERVWDNNLGNAGIFDYIVGRASLVAGNPRYKGERSGFQGGRAQNDNVYLALFLQNGLIGVGLFFLPLFLLLINLIRSIRQSTSPINRLKNIWVFGIWVGVFLEMLGISAIPSFGNVTNIFLLVATAPAIVQIAQEPSLAKDRYSKNIYPKLLFQKST